LVAQYGQPTGHWPYTDLQGYEPMCVYRFDFMKGEEPDKEYRPVHPTPEGWRIGDPPGKLPLFNLNKLAAAQFVVVVEGEKCACLVDSIELVGTTSAHGANSAKKTDWSPLAGKSVMVLPDYEDGDGYAETVAGILTALDPPAMVKVLRLPGLKNKGDDIEQWLAGLPQTWTVADRRNELERLWRDLPVWTPPPVEPPKPPLGIDENGFNLPEWGNAQRLIRAYADRIRYDHSRNAWVIWDGRRWDPSDKVSIWRFTKETIRQLLIEASEIGDHDLSVRTLRWALFSQRKKIMAATIDLAWSEPGIGVVADDFDRDQWLLNCPNDTVNLRTGELRPHDRAEMISKLTLCDYDPTAHCPRWKDALNLIFDSDEELIGYFQRALGYSLTGDTSLQVLFLCYGKGRNGKNTIVDTARTILAEYATIIPPRIFLTAGKNEHPAALADLVGRRFIATSEVDKGERLAESLIKRLTGNRTIKARFMHQNPFEFAVTIKLWMLANAMPQIQGRDEGIWSRIKLIPFEVFIPREKRIPNVSNILVAEEGPGILGWMVQGAL
jgi:putative DNA primase/helicase